MSQSAANKHTSTFTSQLYKSRLVLLEWMEAQGFNIADHEGFSVNEVNAMRQQDQLDLLLTTEGADPATNTAATATAAAAGGAVKKVYIKYFLSKLLQLKNLQEMVDDLFYLEGVLTKQDTLYVVVKRITDSLQSAVAHLWETDGVHVVLVTLEQLQFNVLSHILVPKHRILSEAEQADVMRRFHITQLGEFPEISRFDPVATAIGLRPGQVCEIIRPSKTAITGLYYRVCV